MMQSSNQGKPNPVKERVGSWSTAWSTTKSIYAVENVVNFITKHLWKHMQKKMIVTTQDKTKIGCNHSSYLGSMKNNVYTVFKTLASDLTKIVTS
jgi:hypothetical protein